MSTSRVVRILRCSVAYILHKLKRISFEAFLGAGTTVWADHDILVTPVWSVKIALDFNYVTFSIGCLAIPRHGISIIIEPIVVALSIPNATYVVGGFSV